MIHRSKIKSLSLIISIGLVMSACQATSQGRTSRTVDGTNLGKTSWHNISRTGSQISIAGDVSLVIARRAQSLPSRYQEVLRIKNGGIIFYEELYGSFFRDSDDKEYLIETVGRPLKNFGFDISRNDIKSADVSEGDIIYAVKADSTRSCAVFNGYAGVSTYGKGNKHYFG